MVRRFLSFLWKVGSPFSEKHYGEHRKIQENDRPPTNLGEAVGKLIATQDARTPAEEYGPKQFPAGFRYQP